MSGSAPNLLHQRILDAACALFLEDGYRVSMDALARRADVSKQTVYAHFGSKDELFRAAVDALVRPLYASLEPRQDDIATTLQALSDIYQRHISDPATLALGRMLVAEAPRFPRAARALYRAGTGALLERLAARLQQSMRRGEVRDDDPLLAAELFLSMLNGVEPERRLLGVRQRGRKAQDEWATHVVKTFLRAYAPDIPSPEHQPRTSP